MNARKRLMRFGLFALVTFASAALLPEIAEHTWDVDELLVDLARRLHNNANPR